VMLETMLAAPSDRAPGTIEERAAVSPAREDEADMG
jgi:hypothetical protein